MRPIVLVVTLLALAAASAGPAGARPRHHTPPPTPCSPRQQEHVEARSASAVVLVRYADSWTLIGCEKANGRRRVIMRAPNEDGPSLHQVRMRGTAVVYSLLSHYDTGGDTLVADDAIHSGRRAVIRKVPASSFISNFMLGPGGAVAWTEGDQDVVSLLVHRPGDVARAVDEGTALYGISFTGRALTWHHDVERRSVALRPQDRCPASALVAGNDVLDVLRTPVGAALCMRSTGAQTDVAEADPAAVVLAGTWAAAWEGRRLEAVDAQSGARRTLTTDATPGPVVIDAHGSVAWAEITTSPAHTIVHADDAAGSRVLWEGDTAIAWLAHDRSEVLFAPDPRALDVTATLTP